MAQQEIQQVDSDLVTQSVDPDVKFRMELMMEYEIIEMEKDGNCLFAALATHLFGTPGRQRDVRLKIFKHITSNYAEYQNFIINFNNGERPLESLDDIFTDGKWGGNLSLDAARKAFGLNIILHQPEQPAMKMPPNLSYDDTVNLSFHSSESHYNLLRLKTGDHVGSGSSSQADVKFDIVEEAFTRNDVVVLPESLEQSSQPTTNLPTYPSKERGLHYLARNFYYSGRDEIAIVILVPRYAAKDTLMETLIEGKPNHILIGLQHHAHQLHDIVRDVDIPKIYDIFILPKTMPMDILLSRRSMWLAKILILYVILGSSHVEWKGIKLKFWYNHKQSGLPTTLINNVWLNVRREVMRDASLIIKNPDSFICSECNPSCTNSHKQWHVDLHAMKKAMIEEATSKEFIERVHYRNPNREPSIHTIPNIISVNKKS